MFFKNKHVTSIFDIQSLISVIIAWILSMPIEDWLKNNYSIDYTSDGSFFDRLLLFAIFVVLFNLSSTAINKIKSYINL
ncbi:MAG: hypothetical protein K0Q53_1790 [Massilibacillus sp.]|jgi:hypothetical protein|nr:hypothetical protein [Massilibacillus sp.]